MGQTQKKDIISNPLDLQFKMRDQMNAGRWRCRRTSGDNINQRWHWYKHTSSVLINFFRYCTKKNVEVGSEGE